jgi:hypothetical protein
LTIVGRMKEDIRSFLDTMSAPGGAFVIGFLLAYFLGVDAEKAVLIGTGLGVLGGLIASEMSA